MSKHLNTLIHYSPTHFLIELFHTNIKLYPLGKLPPNSSNATVTSGTFSFLLTAVLLPHASAPYNTVCTIIIPSYIQFFWLIPNPIMLSTHSRAPHVSYPSFILCTTTISLTPSAATLLNSYPHSLQNFYFCILYQTDSPLCTTSPQSLPLVWINQSYSNWAPVTSGVPQSRTIIYRSRYYFL